MKLGLCQNLAITLAAIPDQVGTLALIPSYFATIQIITFLAARYVR